MATRPGTGGGRPRTSLGSAARLAYPGRCHDADHRPRSALGRAHRPGPDADRTDLRHPYPRVPDERPRLRAARRPARDRRLPRRRRPAAGASGPRWPTSSSSTRARSARTPTTSSTATSASCGRPRAANPDLQIAVGGCLAQKDRAAIVDRAPWVDVVFGTHNIGSLPALLDRARHNRRAEVEIVEALETFPSTLPTRRDSAYSAWVSISVGCNNTCTFCIVPSLRGPEVDRRPGEILAEVEALVAQGVVEVTLLGQNVNTYGVGFGDRLAFGKLLRACGEIDGLERVRFTSPHPAAFTDDVIDAMAQTPERHAQPAHAAAVRLRRRAQGDAPLLPGRALPADHRDGPRPHSGRGDHDRHHRRLPRRDRRRLRARRLRSSSVPGSPAPSPSSTRSVPAPPRPTMPDQVPKAVVQERFDRLIALQEEVSWAGNRALEGREVEVLVAPGEGRKDGEHRPAQRPGTGQPARPRRRPRGRRACLAPATPSPWPSPTGHRTTSSPTPALRRRVRMPSAAPRGGDAWAAPPGRAGPAASPP